MRKPLSLLVALCMGIPSVPAQAQTLPPSGWNARLFIEIPLGDAGPRTAAPTLGFTLHQQVNPGKLGTGVDLRWIDMRLDATTAALRRMDLAGHDLLALPSRLHADAPPGTAPRRPSSDMTVAVVLGVAVVGLAVLAARQTEKGVQSGLEGLNNAVDASYQPFTKP